jgi:hypothetical protein
MLAAWLAGNFEEALKSFDPDLIWDNRNRPEGWISHGTEEMQTREAALEAAGVRE